MLKDYAVGECFVGSENGERPRNIGHDAEPQQIESEEMKLSEIREAFAEIVQADTANIRNVARSLFFEGTKPQNHTKRHPKGVQRNTAEK
jgi:hypothetical protein